MLKFKEFLQNEELTVGRHNDGASQYGQGGAYVPSEFGSETFPKSPNHLPGTDMPLGLPRQTFKGRVYDVTFDRGGFANIHMDGGTTQRRVDYEALKRLITGFTSIKEMKNKTLTLTTQGFDKHGNPHIIAGTLT